MISKFVNYISIQKRKFKYKKISYSFNGVDLIIDYIFKDKNDGTYLDIGAQHPISNNNTFSGHYSNARGNQAKLTNFYFTFMFTNIP